MRSCLARISAGESLLTSTGGTEVRASNTIGLAAWLTKKSPRPGNHLRAQIERADRMRQRAHGNSVHARAGIIRNGRFGNVAARFDEDRIMQPRGVERLHRPGGIGGGKIIEHQDAGTSAAFALEGGEYARGGECLCD